MMLYVPVNNFLIMYFGVDLVLGSVLINDNNAETLSVVSLELAKNFDSNEPLRSAQLPPHLV